MSEEVPDVAGEDCEVAPSTTEQPRPIYPSKTIKYEPPNYAEKEKVCPKT